LGGQLPQQTLANVCAASRESINRCLGGWQRRGIGETEKRTIRKLVGRRIGGAKWMTLFSRTDGGMHDCLANHRQTAEGKNGH
jgi:hypothetical protein